MSKVTVEVVKAAVENFNRVQYKYVDMGAADSEPSYHFRCMMRNAIKGGEFKAKTAREWELFTSYAACGNAARSLNAAAKKAHAVMVKAPDDVKHLVAYYYGWD